ncbi:MAG: glycosyl hydrolase [Verrucomicrobiota bacterium]
MKKLFFLTLVLITGSSTVKSDTLDTGFTQPPPTAKPWVYWMWLRVDTTQEAITADLEEMHAKGIEGVILYDSGVGGGLEISAKMVLKGKGFSPEKTSDYQGGYIDKISRAPLDSWTPHSRELVRFASKEAGRLGIKLCLTVGLAGTSGPIDPEFGQQKLVWSETAVSGSQPFDAILSAPDTEVPSTLEPPSPKKPVNKPAAPAGKPKPVRPKDTYPNAHPIAVLAVPDEACFSPSRVIDLSNKVDATGRLRWDAPAGAWKILRFGYTPTGARNVWGTYTDCLSTAAMDKTWDATIGVMLKEMTPDERKGLYAIEDDSWESGVTSWTKLFPEEFKQLRGYDLIRWLPALAGKKMGEIESAGVRRDFYRTIADMVAKNHYARLGDLAKQNSLVAFAEPAGPNTNQLDLMKDCRGVGIAMGEFWVPSIHRPSPPRRFMLRAAASANHIYGKTLTPCESLTSVGPFWEESFFDLKNTADQGFCDGCNLLVIHNWSHSPSVTAKPGYAYFAGTLYGRNTTWWEQTPAFNAYLGRCSFLLQQGLFVADALYYRGDAIGQGEQMKPRPALPAEGYDHDNCNLDALLTRVSVKDGRLVLPDGMSYRMLVIPNDFAMAPEALDKIASLVEGGATVVGPRPSGPAGLLTPEKKAKFNTLTERLWANESGNNRIGTGQVFAGKTPAEVLQEINLPPDFAYTGLSSDGDIDWIHRRTNDADIYFVASRWDPKEKVDCTFRVSGKQPELWNPITGEIRDALAFTRKDGCITVPLEFNPRESVFVVFRKPVSSGHYAGMTSNYPKTTPHSELTGSWEVSFDPKWGGPEKVVFDALVDWTKRPEDGIKHYSGTAVYRKKFNLAELPVAGEKHLLDLGDVREEAVVKLNGVDLGVVWTKPARVDISAAVRAGENELEITVVNLWPNRLIGDASLPPEKRLTETNIRKFVATTPLLPSGLLGPVTILSQR